ncbi:MAG: twin-arginine translocation signal domain-containing protein [Candidatus Thermoplasmatota archaeon]|nr:twin-arginine translocation signal domain-containing protein [Candidatus Thermoplasmatota archaeon]
MSQEDEAKKGITRRGFVKGAIAAGAASVVAVGGYTALQTLTGERRPIPQETFLYLNPEGAEVPPWFVERGLIGKEARLSHFGVGDGANVLWIWHIDEGGNPAGGVSALLMHVDEQELEFPPGYVREEFVVEGLYAVFNCCTHVCCRAGWRLIRRSMYRNELGFDTIYCVCHDAQFHPTRIVEATHPSPPQGARYIGVAHIAGPGYGGMPLIPLEVRDDLILGKLREPDWYRYLDTMTRPLP